VTTISVELSEQEEQQLRARARELQVTPEALAAALVKTNLVINDDSAFKSAAVSVIEKNRELYRRLA
jgi:hypothetical protein